MSYIHTYHMISFNIVFYLILYSSYCYYSTRWVWWHADFPRCHLSFLACDLGFGKPAAQGGYPNSQHIWKTPNFHIEDTNIHNSPNPQLPKFLHLESSENFQWMICRDRGDVPALRYWWLRRSGLPRLKTWRNGRMGNGSKKSWKNNLQLS